MEINKAHLQSTNDVKRTIKEIEMNILEVIASCDEVWDALVEHAEVDGGFFMQPNKYEDYEVHNNNDPDGVTEIEIHDERWLNELTNILGENFNLIP